MPPKLSEGKRRSDSENEIGKMARTGRPSIADKIDREKLKELYLDGKTDKEIADIFGISRRTLVNWRKKNPDFVLTLKDDWKKVADHRVERSLYERACGYEHQEVIKAQWVDGKWEYADGVKHYPPDTTAMIFWLKNRNPAEWRDKLDHELSGKDGGPIEQRWTNFPEPAKDIADWEKQVKEADGDMDTAAGAAGKSGDVPS